MVNIDHVISRLSKTITPPLLSISRKVSSYDHIQQVQHENTRLYNSSITKILLFIPFFSLSLSLSSFSSPSLPSLVVRKSPLKKSPIFSKNNFDFLFKNSSSPLKKFNFPFKNLIFHFFYFIPKKFSFSISKNYDLLSKHPNFTLKNF